MVKLFVTDYDPTIEDSYIQHTEIDGQWYRRSNVYHQCSLHIPNMNLGRMATLPSAKEKVENLKAHLKQGDVEAALGLLVGLTDDLKKLDDEERQGRLVVAVIHAAYHDYLECLTPDSAHETPETTFNTLIVPPYVALICTVIRFAATATKCNIHNLLLFCGKTLVFCKKLQLPVPVQKSMIQLVISELSSTITAHVKEVDRAVIVKLARLSGDFCCLVTSDDKGYQTLYAIRSLLADLDTKSSLFDVIGYLQRLLDLVIGFFQLTDKEEKLSAVFGPSGMIKDVYNALADGDKWASESLLAFNNLLLQAVQMWQKELNKNNWTDIVKNMVSSAGSIENLISAFKNLGLLLRPPQEANKQADSVRSIHATRVYDILLSITQMHWKTLPNRPENIEHHVKEILCLMGLCSEALGSCKDNVDKNVLAEMDIFDRNAFFHAQLYLKWQMPTAVTQACKTCLHLLDEFPQIERTVKNYVHFLYMMADAQLLLEDEKSFLCTLTEALQWSVESVPFMMGPWKRLKKVNPIWQEKSLLDVMEDLGVLSLISDSDAANILIEELRQSIDRCIINKGLLDSNLRFSKPLKMTDGQQILFVLTFSEAAFCISEFNSEPILALLQESLELQCEDAILRAENNLWLYLWKEKQHQQMLEASNLMPDKITVRLQKAVLGEEQNKDDVCGVAPSYTSLSLGAHVDRLRHLDSALQILRKLDEQGVLKEEEGTGMFGKLHLVALHLLSHGHVTRASDTLLLRLHLALQLDDPTKILQAGIDILDQCPWKLEEPWSIISTLEAQLEKCSGSVDKLRLSLLVGKAKICFYTGKTKKGFQALDQVFRDPYLEQHTYSSSRIEAKALILLSKYLLIPMGTLPKSLQPLARCYQLIFTPEVALTNAFRTLAGCLKAIAKEKTGVKPEDVYETVLVFINCSLEVGEWYVSLSLPREIRAYTREALFFTQRAGYSLPTGKLLALAGRADLLCEKEDETTEKLHCISDILSMESRANPTPKIMQTCSREASLSAKKTPRLGPVTVRQSGSMSDDDDSFVIPSLVSNMKYVSLKDSTDDSCTMSPSSLFLKPEEPKYLEAMLQHNCSHSSDCILCENVLLRSLIVDAVLIQVDLYVMKKCFDDALKIIKQAETIFTSQQGFQAALITLHKLRVVVMSGELKLRKEEPESALASVNEGMKLFHSLQYHPGLVLEHYRTLHLQLELLSRQCQRVIQEGKEKKEKKQLQQHLALPSKGGKKPDKGVKEMLEKRHTGMKSPFRNLAHRSNTPPSTGKSMLFQSPPQAPPRERRIHGGLVRATPEKTLDEPILDASPVTLEPEAEEEPKTPENLARVKVTYGKGRKKSRSLSSPPSDHVVLPQLPVVYQDPPAPARPSARSRVRRK
ncbi:unnamed protein product [Darwinula stevensoni]|uniref:Uncharacterized protein n=1 Tax=Darwinula stevensoni TaxID=69355 RepID=A0A7R9ACU2_9CRUS|nr:unnamed protein product [Darwinula stevensoni]CAG0900686.1 unnamed protein product [Darwinula stevensoni]